MKALLHVATAAERVAATIDAPGLVADLEASLRAGELINTSPLFVGAVAKAYAQCSPALLVLAAIESGGTVTSAYALYDATLELGYPRLAGWDGLDKL